MHTQLFPSDKQKNPYTKKTDKTPTDYNGMLAAMGAFGRHCLPEENTDHPLLVNLFLLFMWLQQVSKCDIYS
jgi:hypothetical protein